MGFIGEVNCYSLAEGEPYVYVRQAVCADSLCFRKENIFELSWKLY